MTEADSAYGDLDDYEPIASCKHCEADMYSWEDDGSDLCDQCQWWLAQYQGGDDEEECS